MTPVDPLLEEALSRGWLTPEQRDEILRLCERNPELSVAELVEQHTELDVGQISELLGKTVRVPAPTAAAQQSHADREDAAPGADRYQFGQLLGQGGMGQVLRWKEFIASEAFLGGRQFTTREILRHGARLKRQFGIVGRHMPFVD